MMLCPKNRVLGTTSVDKRKVMPVHKVVFRADFSESCYSVLDKQGTVLSLMNSHSDKGWSELRDGDDHSKVAIFRDGDPVSFYQNVAFSYNSLAFCIEFSKAIDIEDIYSSDKYTKTFKICQALLNEFSINKFRRCGIRIYHTDTIAGIDSVHDRFSSSLHPDIAKITSDILGSQEDYMIRMVGKHQNNIKYSVSFGPHKADENKRFFENTYESIQDSTDVNFIYDLDLYEHEVFDKSKNIIHWTKPLLLSAAKYINLLTNDMAKIMENAK